jgi:valyl-tRNA synthetase
VAKGIAGAEGKLNNEKFLAKAPPEVVASEKQRLSEMKARLEQIEKALGEL